MVQHLYVCVYACVYVCMLQVYVYTAYTESDGAASVCMYVRVHVCIYVMVQRLYVYVYVCMLQKV